MLWRWVWLIALKEKFISGQSYPFAAGQITAIFLDLNRLDINIAPAYSFSPSFVFLGA